MAPRRLSAFRKAFDGVTPAFGEGRLGIQEELFQILNLQRPQLRRRGVLFLGELHRTSGRFVGDLLRKVRIEPAHGYDHSVVKELLPAIANALQFILLIRPQDWASLRS